MFEKKFFNIQFKNKKTWEPSFIIRFVLGFTSRNHIYWNYEILKITAMTEEFRKSNLIFFPDFRKLLVVYFQFFWWLFTCYCFSWSYRGSKFAILANLGQPAPGAHGS